MIYDAINYYKNNRNNMSQINNNNEINDSDTIFRKDVGTNTDEAPPVYSVVFVMDESGSMTGMGKEPLDGLNNFFAMQNQNGEFYATLITFSDRVKFVFKNVEGKNIKKLTESDYCPNGMTALYDAIGSGIDYQKTLKTDNVIFVILTDGLENSSRDYKKNDIFKMITTMKTDHNWDFVYLGANQDSFGVGQSIGITTTRDFEYSPLGCEGLMRSISNTVSECISGKKNSIEEDFILLPPATPLQEEEDNNELNLNFKLPNEPCFLTRS